MCRFKVRSKKFIILDPHIHFLSPKSLDDQTFLIRVCSRIQLSTLHFLTERQKNET